MKESSLSPPPNFVMVSIFMLLKQVLGHEDILQFVANTGPNIADKMTFVEMLLDFVVILVVYVLKLGEVFLTNFAFQMC